jgi:hypothetical protein
MGAHLYCYFTPWNADIGAALQALREAEFKAGRYEAAMQAANPPKYMFELSFPPDGGSPAPGPVHPSIEAVMEDVEEDGTGSILDIMWVADEPNLCTAVAVTDEDLSAMFGTTRPSRAHVEAVFVRPGAWDKSGDILERIGRGEARYFAVYDGERPSEIFFLGYSFD